MSTSITTFLTYDTQAEEAAKLYTSLFGGKITETRRYPAGGPRPEGAVLSAAEKTAGVPERNYLLLRLARLRAGSGVT